MTPFVLQKSTTCFLPHRRCVFCAVHGLEEHCAEAFLVVYKEQCGRLVVASHRKSDLCSRPCTSILGVHLWSSFAPSASARSELSRPHSRASKQVRLTSLTSRLPFFWCLDLACNQPTSDLVTSLSVDALHVMQHATFSESMFKWNFREHSLSSHQCHLQPLSFADLRGIQSTSFDVVVDDLVLSLDHRPAASKTLQRLQTSIVVKHCSS